MAKTSETPKVKRFGFVDYLEAWITGYNYRTDHPEEVPPGKGANKLMAAVKECYDRSGGERGKRVARELTGKQIPELDLSPLTELQCRLLKIQVMHMDVGTTDEAWMKISRELGVPAPVLKRHAAELNAIINGEEQTDGNDGRSD